MGLGATNLYICLLLFYYRMWRTFACTVGMVLLAISVICYITVVGVGWADFNHIKDNETFVLSNHTEDASRILAAAIVSTVPGLFLLHTFASYCTMLMSSRFSDTGKAILTCVLTCEIFAAVIQIIGGIMFIYAGVIPLRDLGPGIKDLPLIQQIFWQNVFAYGVSAGACGIIGGCAGFWSQVCCCTLLCTPNTRELDPGRLL